MIEILKKWYLWVSVTALLSLFSIYKFSPLGELSPLVFPDVMPGFYVMIYECFQDRATFEFIKNKPTHPKNLEYYQYVREITGIEKETIGSCKTGLLTEVAHPISGADMGEIIRKAKKFDFQEIGRLTNGKQKIDDIKNLP